MKKLNWNSIIKVKLTDYGKDIFRGQFDELNKKLAEKGQYTFPRPEPTVDENGMTRFQLWHFMQMYGNYIGMALPLVTEGPDFYIDIDDLEDYMKIIEVNLDIRELVEANDGYCPCMIQKNDDTKCMCKEFKEQTTPGLCHCGRFEKVNM